MKSTLLLVIALLMLATASASAQVDSARVDTAAPAARADSVPGEYVMTKSPTTAILLSIVPGGGQWYTEQYWKSVLFFGVGAFFIGRIVYYQNLFAEKAAEVDALDLNDPNRLVLRTQREFYRDQRDLNGAYFIGLQVLSMIDAYVGAHLFDFDTTPEGTSSRIYLDPSRPGIGVGIRF